MTKTTCIFVIKICAAMAFLPYTMPTAMGDVLELDSATVVAAADSDGFGGRIATWVQREVQKRSGLQWTVAAAGSNGTSPVIYLATCDNMPAGAPALAGRLADKVSLLVPESYGIVSTRDPNGRAGVVIIGKDRRGMMYGAGRLLRSLEMTGGSVKLPAPVDEISSPYYPIRGIQLGYRAMSNCYGAWTLEEYEQQICDLAVFGCNTIELIGHFESTEGRDFKVEPRKMIVDTSRLAASYDMDVCVWYPVLEKDYSREDCMQRTLVDFETLCQNLPRLDALYVPGGDPGHTPPELLLPLVEKMAGIAKKYHPNASMWISPQGFNHEKYAYFFDYINRNQPAWLEGIISAPWAELEPEAIRRRLSPRYKLRSCTDIGHVLHCQHPAENLDTAHAITSGREPVCPRPGSFRKIMKVEQPWTSGSVAYSDGCNDDINKIVWLSLGWNPEMSVRDILLDYERYFIDSGLGGKFADGIETLESNVDGALLGNAQVANTLALFRELEARDSRKLLGNWRFVIALYRAYFDYYTQLRLTAETKAEANAMDILRKCQALGAGKAMRNAEAALRSVVAGTREKELRNRIFELGDMLNQMIHFKLSVKLHKALNYRRGATLDTMDWPLNNRSWLEAQFTLVRKMPDEHARCERLLALANWTDPGPSGVYDDFGNPGAKITGRVITARTGDYPTSNRIPHITKNWIRGSDFASMRISWMDHVATYGDTPLVIRYDNLSPEADYELVLVYGETKLNGPVKLTANERFEIHSYLPSPSTMEPLVFPVPREATNSGELTLKWERQANLSNINTVCHVSELWLRIKK